MSLYCHTYKKKTFIMSLVKMQENTKLEKLAAQPGVMQIISNSLPKEAWVITYVKLVFETLADGTLEVKQSFENEVSSSMLEIFQRSKREKVQLARYLLSDLQKKRRVSVILRIVQVKFFSGIQASGIALPDLLFLMFSPDSRCHSWKQDMPSYWTTNVNDASNGQTMTVIPLVFLKLFFSKFSSPPCTPRGRVLTCIKENLPSFLESLLPQQNEESAEGKVTCLTKENDRLQNKVTSLTDQNEKLQDLLSAANIELNRLRREREIHLIIVDNVIQDSVILANLRHEDIFSHCSPTHHHIVIRLFGGVQRSFQQLVETEEGKRSGATQTLRQMLFGVIKKAFGMCGSSNGIHIGKETTFSDFMLEWLAQVMKQTSLQCGADEHEASDEMPTHAPLPLVTYLIHNVVNVCDEWKVNIDKSSFWSLLSELRYLMVLRGIDIHKTETNYQMQKGKRKRKPDDTESPPQKKVKGEITSFFP